jgi:Xaa-Pro aminopeptidase
MMSFETLTLAPIDRRLIIADMLGREERAWINSYHAHVFDTLSPKLDPTARSWLQQATEPI